MREIKLQSNQIEYKQTRPKNNTKLT